MKKNIFVLTLAITSTLFSCVNSDNYSAPDLSSECNDKVATKSIVDVAAVATAVPQQWNSTTDSIISAYVVSSDEGGNFYKSLSLVSLDGTKGFSVPIDDYNLYSKYEPGRQVFINLSKKYYANNTQTASLNVGNLYEGNSIGRLSNVEYQSVVARGCDKVSEESLINHVTISQAKNNANINKLIEFNNVQFKDASLGKKFYDPSLNDIGGATNHEITDEFGNSIIVRVSSFATFASNMTPQGSGKIRGVLTKYNSDYQFMIRTINDVDMTQPRMTIDLYPPIVGSSLVYNSTLNEPFTSYTTTNQQNFPAYINDAVVGSRYWQVKTFSGNKYIQMTSFGGTPEINKTMFFVPVNLTTANTLSFKTKAGFANGTCLKVYYSTNYVPGTNVNNATLVDITSNFTIDPGSASGYPANFTSSGTWNIPAVLTGNGFFIFEYNGNGNGGVTTTMQIDDITIN